MKHSRAAAAALSLLILCGCTEHSAPVPDTAEAPATSTEATETTKTDLSAPAEPEVFVPERVETDWGWYEVLLPEYAGWTFSPKKDFSAVLIPPENAPSDANNQPLHWNAVTQCYSADSDADDQDLYDQQAEPIVRCALLELEPLLGGEPFVIPACEEITPEIEALLYPADMEELMQYSALNYADYHEEIMDYYVDDPAKIFKNCVVSDDMMEKFADPVGRYETWCMMVEQIAYNDAHLYNLFAPEGLQYDVGSYYDDEGFLPYYKHYLTKWRYELENLKFEPIWNDFMDEIRAETEGMTPMQTALMVAQYICLHCKYDPTLQSRTARQAIMSGETVCSGYAQWFNAAMQELGYQVTFVRSTELLHIWSLLYLPDENRWAEIDVTFMDGVYEDASSPTGLSDFICMDFFDFSSLDPEKYEWHCTNDQDTPLTYITEPAPTRTKGGYGYQFDQSIGNFVTHIDHVEGDLFHLTWTDGKVTDFHVR